MAHSLFGALTVIFLFSATYGEGPEFIFPQSAAEYILASFNGDIVTGSSTNLPLSSLTVDFNHSSLSNSSATLTLFNPNATITLNFEKKDNAITWKDLIVHIAGPNKTASFPLNRDLGKSTESFECRAFPDLHDSSNITVTFVHVQLQPFSKSKTFGEAVSCPEDKPAPAPLTTPAPASKEGKWDLFGKNNFLCLEFVAEVVLDVRYKANSTDKIAKIQVPPNAVVLNSNSSCGGVDEANRTLYDDQVLELQLENGHSLKFEFSEKDIYTKKNKTWTMFRVTFSANMSDAHYFPGSTQVSETFSNVVTVNGTGALKFITGEKQYWSCSPGVSYPVGDSMNLTLSSAKIFAYAHNSTQDKTAHYCAQEDVTNDLVPIIVGAALAALVVIVLVAYLVGRFRVRRATGYENV